MIPILIIIFSILLLLFSILDIKTRAVPSIILTGTILILASLKFANIQFAVLFGIIGIMLWEFSEGQKASFGTADIKIMIMLGFFIASLSNMLIIAIIFSITQVIYIFTITKFTKYKEVPLIPLFLAIWVGGLIGGIFV